MAKPLPSVEKVRELFDYDPQTGVMVTRAARARSPAGSIVGTVNNRNRLVCRVDYEIYYVHRLAWLHYYGEEPPLVIDHINGDPLDNRISNLRAASQAENVRNRAPRKVSACGLKGVTKGKKGFEARIGINGAVLHLGTFSTAEAAHQAYAEASSVHHGQFGRTS